MMSNFELLLNDDSTHYLLEPPTPAYTSVTVRRAFIVWFHCGQHNEFRQVCNYFHYLEMLEENLSPEVRISSRLHEFNLLSSLPPSSNYLNIHFSKLYRQSKQNKVNVKQIEEMKLVDCIFNLEGFYDLKIQKAVTTKDIIKTSQMIRKYCKVHCRTLKNFLLAFLDFAKKTETKNTVSNISVYIKKKYVEDDLVTYKNMPKDFSFLNTVENVSDINVNIGQTVVNKIKNTSILDVVNNVNEIKSTNKIRILINEARKKELINLVPQLSDLSIADSENKNCTSENLISTKIKEDHKKTPKDEFEPENKL